MVQLVGTKQLPPQARDVTALTFFWVLYNVYADKTKIQPRWLKMGHKTIKRQESPIKLLYIKYAHQNNKTSKRIYCCFVHGKGRGALYFYELSHKVDEYIWKWTRRPEKSEVSLITVLDLPAHPIWRVILTVKGQINSLCKHKSVISWILRNTTQFRQPLINFP